MLLETFVCRSKCFAASVGLGVYGFGFKLSGLGIRVSWARLAVLLETFVCRSKCFAASVVLRVLRFKVEGSRFTG